MNLNLYLPDDLGERAKAEGLKLSRLLRDAVVRELHRRSVTRQLLSDEETYEVELGENLGSVGIPSGAYTGLIRGKLVLGTPGWEIYLTSDHRVITYERPEVSSTGAGICHVLGADASEHELVDFLRAHIDVDPEFVEACRALGVRPVVEL